MSRMGVFISATVRAVRVCMASVTAELQRTDTLPAADKPQIDTQTKTAS